MNASLGVFSVLTCLLLILACLAWDEASGDTPASDYSALLGTKVQLPSTDVIGRPIPKSGCYVYVSSGCGGCGFKTKIFSSDEHRLIRPVVFLFPDEIDSLKLRQDDGSPMALIVEDIKQVALPKAVYHLAPLILQLNEHHSTVGVARNGVATLNDFEGLRL